MDDISSCSDDEYGPLASTWGDQAKDTNADVIEAWRSLADPNAKLGPKGLGSGGLHRRGKNYKPVDEEVILKQREKTAAMRPKPKSKSGSHRREGGGGASEKKTSRSKGGNIHKKEHSQQQQPNHWNPFRSTSKPLPDSQPAWLKETASSYFRSREKSVDDSQYRVPASWGITPLPPPPPPSQQAPSSSLASPNKPSSVRFSEPITTSMTSPPPSPPSSASTANTPTFELPSRRPPPKGGKFVWLDQPLSNQPFWEQPNVTNSNKNNNQHLPDSPSPDDNKKATVTCDQNAVSWQNQDRSSTAWESQQQQQQQQHSPSKADWPRTGGGSEEKASPEQPNADWGKFSFGQTDAVADRSDTATKSSLNNNKEKPPSSKRRVRFDDSTIKPEYHEEKTETSKTTSSSPPPPSSSQTSQSEADKAWNKNDFTTDPSAYRWGDIKQNSSYNMDTNEASSGSNWGDNNKAAAATSERDKPTTDQQALSSTSNWSDTKATWQQDAAGWNDTPRWNDATAAARSKTEWGNDTSSAAGWNTSSSNDNWVTTTSSTSWSDNKNDNKYTNQEATPHRFSRPERPKYSKRGSTPLPVNYRQDVPIAPPKEVAPPPSAENPIIISINVELRPGQKIPVNIRLLDDTNHLAQKFATDHNITAPPIVDALRQLFSSQKRIAMKKRSRKL